MHTLNIRSNRPSDLFWPARMHNLTMTCVGNYVYMTHNVFDHVYQTLVSCVSKSPVYHKSSILITDKLIISVNQQYNYYYNCHSYYL